MPKILVTRRTFSVAAAALRASGADVVIWENSESPSQEDLIKAVGDVDGLYAHITNQVNAEVMDAAPNLKVIAEFGVGFDNIDIKAANERGIAVCNTPGILSETTADEAFALLASMARRINYLSAMVKRGEWGDFDPLSYLGNDIHHKTLGIVGMGKIGSEMAKRATGFNMNILYFNRNKRDEELGARYVDSLEELLERSDFVSLHNPLTPETFNMMSTAQFKLMKKTAILINTTRGAVVDQDALYMALKSGEIAGAALDVTVPEPIPVDHPLLTLDNCLIMPHVASATVDTRMKMAMMSVENVLSAVTCDWPPYCVNQAEIAGNARLKS
jgi:glyoxylate reductase